MNLALIQESHLSSLARVAADDRIAQTSGVPVNCSEDDVREWMNTSQVPASKEMYYVLLVEGKPAGCCILRKLTGNNAKLSCRTGSVLNTGGRGWVPGQPG